MKRNGFRICNLARSTAAMRTALVWPPSSERRPRPVAKGQPWRRWRQRRSPHLSWKFSVRLRDSTFALLGWRVFALVGPGVSEQGDWESVWRCPVCLCRAEEAEAGLPVKRAGGPEVVRHVEVEVQVLRGG